MQLVGQVLCLEEMCGFTIERAVLYYKSIHRRIIVEITQEKRRSLQNILKEMRKWMQLERIPWEGANKNCKLCSLEEKCMPKVQKKLKTGSYYILERTGVSYEKT